MAVSFDARDTSHQAVCIRSVVKIQIATSSATKALQGSSYRIGCRKESRRWSIFNTEKTGGVVENSVHGGGDLRARWRLAVKLRGFP